MLELFLPPMYKNGNYIVEVSMFLPYFAVTKNETNQNNLLQRHFFRYDVNASLYYNMKFA